MHYSFKFENNGIECVLKVLLFTAFFVVVAKIGFLIPSHHPFNPFHHPMQQFHIQYETLQEICKQVDECLMVRIRYF